MQESTKPKVDELGLEIIKKIEAGQCAYYPRENNTGYLYIPYDKARAIEAKIDKSKNPFGPSLIGLEKLHAQIFDGSYSLGIDDVGNSEMMELPRNADINKVNALISLIDSQSTA